MVLNQGGQTLSSEDVWQCLETFLLPLRGGHYWHRGGEGQGCRLTRPLAVVPQTANVTKNYPAKMSTEPWARNCSTTPKKQHWFNKHLLNYEIALSFQGKKNHEELYCDKKSRLEFAGLKLSNRPLEVFLNMHCLKISIIQI